MPYAIVHFEIPADDVTRAQKFYKQAFGWKISDPHNMGSIAAFQDTEGNLMGFYQAPRVPKAPAAKKSAKKTAKKK